MIGVRSVGRWLFGVTRVASLRCCLANIVERRPGRGRSPQRQQGSMLIGRGKCIILHGPRSRRRQRRRPLSYGLRWTPAKTAPSPTTPNRNTATPCDIAAYSPATAPAPIPLPRERSGEGARSAPQPTRRKADSQKAPHPTSPQRGEEPPFRIERPSPADYFQPNETDYVNPLPC